jgi:hypothetical protein
VNEFVPICWPNESMVYAHDSECAEYYAIVDQVNEMMACIQVINIAVHAFMPPPIEEMDEVLAFIFTGPCQPTTDDFHRIPLLVH